MKNTPNTKITVALAIAVLMLSAGIASAADVQDIAAGKADRTRATSAPQTAQGEIVDLDTETSSGARTKPGTRDDDDGDGEDKILRPGGFVNLCLQTPLGREICLSF